MKKFASLLATSLCLASVAHAAPSTVPDAVPVAQPSPTTNAPVAAEPGVATPSPSPVPSVAPVMAKATPADSTASATAPQPELGARVSVEAAENPRRARPRQREGFYLRGGSGPGSLSLSGDGPSRSASLSALGSAGSLAIGGSVVPGLVLAGRLRSTTTQTSFKGGPFRSARITVDGRDVAASDKAQASFTELGLLVDWYPNPAAGWHAGVSGGLGVVGIVNSADDSSLFGVTPAGTLFGGYDWAIGGDWSLGLALEVSGAPSATMKHGSGGADAGYRLTPVSVGLEVSILYF